VKLASLATILGGLNNGMKVLPFASDAHRETPINVFAIELSNLEEEYRCALSDTVATSGQPPIFLAQENQGNQTQDRPGRQKSSAAVL
jgi:hypothetical protein